MEGYAKFYWDEMQGRTRKPMDQPDPHQQPIPPNSNTELVKTLYTLLHPASSTQSDLANLSTTSILYRCVDAVREKSVLEDNPAFWESLKKKVAQSSGDCVYWLCKTGEYAMVLGAIASVLGIKLPKDGDSSIELFDAFIDLYRENMGIREAAATLNRVMETYGGSMERNQPIHTAACGVEALMQAFYTRYEDLSRDNNILVMALTEYERITSSIWEGAPHYEDVIHRVKRLSRGEAIEEMHIPSAQHGVESSLLQALTSALPPEFLDMGLTPQTMSSIGRCVGLLKNFIHEKSHEPLLSTFDLEYTAAEVAANQQHKNLSSPQENKHSWTQVCRSLQLHPDSPLGDVTQTIDKLLFEVEEARTMRVQIEALLSNTLHKVSSPPRSQPQTRSRSPQQHRSTSTLISELEIRLANATAPAPSRANGAVPTRTPPRSPELTYQNPEHSNSIHTGDAERTLMDIIHWINDRFIKESIPAAINPSLWWRTHSQQLRKVAPDVNETVLKRIWQKLTLGEIGSAAPQTNNGTDMLFMIEEEVERLQSHAIDCDAVIHMLRDQLPECAASLCAAYSVLSTQVIYSIPEDESEAVQHPLETLRMNLPKLTEKAQSIFGKLLEIENFVASAVASLSRHLNVPPEPASPSPPSDSAEFVTNRIHSLAVNLVKLQHELRRQHHAKESSLYNTSASPPPPSTSQGAQHNHRLMSIAQSLFQVPYFSLHDVQNVDIDPTSGPEALLYKFSTQYKQAVIFLEQDMDAMQSQVGAMLTTLADNISLKELGVDPSILLEQLRMLSRKGSYFQKRTNETNDITNALKTVRVVVQHIVEASRVWVERAQKLQDVMLTTAERLTVCMPEASPPRQGGAPELVVPYLAARVGSVMDNMRRQKDAAESELAILRVRQKSNPAASSMNRSESDDKFEELRAYCHKLRESYDSKKAEIRVLKEMQRDLEHRLTIMKTTSAVASSVSQSRSAFPSPMKSKSREDTPLPPTNAWIEISPSKSGCGVCGPDHEGSQHRYQNNKSVRAGSATRKSTSSHGMYSGQTSNKKLTPFGRTSSRF
eukprot:PhF_6_TR36525/c0_g1_i1/m.53820